MYELALSEYLAAGDGAGFLRAVREEWPPELYSVPAVVKPLVEALLLRPEDEDLQRALATLFSYQVRKQYRTEYEEMCKCFLHPIILETCPYISSDLEYDQPLCLICLFSHIKLLD